MHDGLLQQYISNQRLQLLPCGTSDIKHHSMQVRLFAEFFHVHFLSNFYKVCQAGNKTDNAEAITTLLQGIGVSSAPNSNRCSAAC